MSEEDQVSLLDEPFQSDIIAIARALKSFNPTIIALYLPRDLEVQAQWSGLKMFSQVK